MGSNFIRSDDDHDVAQARPPLRGCIRFFDGWSSVADLVSASLKATFDGVELITAPISVRRSDLGSEDVVDTYFDLDVPLCGDFGLIISPVRIRTAFGYGIAGETRRQTVVVSGPPLTPDNVNRLIRHEIGHVFGLKEHPNCVMWKYFIEDAGYCSACVGTLAARGVRVLESAVTIAGR